MQQRPAECYVLGLLRNFYLWEKNPIAVCLAYVWHSFNIASYLEEKKKPLFIGPHRVIGSFIHKSDGK